MTPKPYDPRDNYNRNGLPAAIPVALSGSNFGAQQPAGSLLPHQYRVNQAKFLASVAAYSDIITLTYNAGTTNGFYESFKSLPAGSVPLVLAWFMGTVDTVTGTPNNNLSDPLHDHMTIAGGELYVDWAEKYIHLSITTTNVGLPNPIKAYVKYFVLNTDTGLKAEGF